MTLSEIFEDTEQYKQAFIQALSEMLDKSDELGVFILVLANATYDKNIYDVFLPRLKTKFEYFRQLFETSDDISKLGAVDDVAVMQKLLEMGFDYCGVNQIRELNGWRLQFNPLRSLRPARNSQLQIASIKQDFDEKAFHFNKHFLVKEELASGEFELNGLEKKHCRILFNKFPFADFHTLLVIDSLKQKSQWLEQDDIYFVWQLMQIQMSAIPDLVLSYNSLGASASINHQHFQLSLAVNGQNLIEGEGWSFNGGANNYPLTCYKIMDKETAWQHINRCQKDNAAFNFILIHQVLYLIPRLKQGEFLAADWLTGFAWSDIFGSLSVLKQNQFLQLQPQTIQQELEKLKHDTK